MKHERLLDPLINEHGLCYLTPREVSDILKVCSKQVARFVQRGELKATNLGCGTRKDLRFTPESIKAFTEARAIGAACPSLKEKGRPTTTMNLSAKEYDFEARLEKRRCAKQKLSKDG